MLWQVSFITSCWEKDYRFILKDDHYLKTLQIAHHEYPFCEKVLIINNVIDKAEVERLARKKVEEGILTRYIWAESIAEEVFAHFQLQKKEFTEWQYYNALAPLAAIFSAKGEYLLYLTGDVRLDKKVNWISKAIRYMEKKKECFVANLTWNEKYKEAKKESFRTTWNFYLSTVGFSDQMFLVRKKDFNAPIYNEIREGLDHFPRGDVWEKRVFSYMKNRNLERITYRRGSYTHENF